MHAVNGQIQAWVDVKEVIDAAGKETPGGRSQNEYLLALTRAEQEKKRLTEAKFRLYDNLERGILDQDEYTQLRAGYNAEIAAQDAQIERLQKSLADRKEARKQDDEFIAFFKKHGSIQAIDRDVLNHLLDHIEVSDSRHIDVYFKFSAERKKSSTSQRTSRI